MDKQNYRVGSTPIRHNGRTFGVGEPVALTADEAKALQGHVTLDPVQADSPAPPAAPPAPAEPPAQAPAPAPADPATPPVPAEPAPETTAQAPKAEAKGKTAKSGEKA